MATKRADHMADEPEPADDAYDYFPESERPLRRLLDALERSDLVAVQALIGEHPHLLGRTVYNEDSELIPLEYAAYDGRDDLVEWLLARGADPNLMSDVGRTALWSAVWQVRQLWVLRNSSRIRGAAEWDDWARRFRVIRLLLGAGADPHRGDGSSPDDVMRDFSQVGLLDSLAEFERLRAAG